MIDLHKLTINEIGDLRRQCEQYMETWFGFSREGKARQTPEWIAAAIWRLEGKTEPCCKCGEDYPAADLHFGGHVYCAKCREAPKNP